MKTLLIISFILLVAVGGLLLVDLVPLLRRWCARIHIGRWKNKEVWKAAVEKSLLSQLKSTPAVPVNDQTRLTAIERLKGDYTSKNLQSWQEAALLLGANKMYNHRAVEGQLKKFINLKIDAATGEWRESQDKVDSAMLAFAILSSPVTDTREIKPAMDTTANLLMGLAEKYGTIPYNKDISNIRFVDTVGMVCPFLFKYGLEYSCDMAVETAKRQIEEFIEVGIHPELKLPVHCYDINSHAPLGIYGWGRGCGWLAVGLMDSYLTLDNASGAMAESLSKINTVDIRGYILNQMMIYAQALMGFQMENGAWARHVFIKDTGESSATAMLGWFMRSMHLITGDDGFKTSAEKAERFLLSSTRLNGVVDYAQGDTKGIGFYSSRLDAMPAAQGFTARSV